MATMDQLRAYSRDVEEGLIRCMNNEAFYLRLVNMAVDDAGFGRLQAAVEAGNSKESFEAAHALKGMLGNLALTPLAEPASEMTELLRGGKDADYTGLYETIREQREKLLALRDEA